MKTEESAGKKVHTCHTTEDSNLHTLEVFSLYSSFSINYVMVVLSNEPYPVSDAFPLRKLKIEETLGLFWVIGLMTRAPCVYANLCYIAKSFMSFSNFIYYRLLILQPTFSCNWEYKPYIGSCHCFISIYPYVQTLNWSAII